MSSKLDQLRDQFRQRLSLRSPNQTPNQIHVINVQNNDNNNNSEIIKTESYSTRSSVPTPTTPTKSLLIDDRKNFNNLSKVSANKSNKSNQFYFKSDSNNGNEVSKGFSYKSIYDKNKEKMSENAVRNRTPNTEALRTANTEGMVCRYCRRRFALSERLEKHESVCMSSLDKSRIRFNSFEQRVRGQPNDYLLIYENALKEEPEREIKASNWRQKHQYCIAAIKTAKGEVSSGPTTSQIMASIQQQCDYCKRRFSDEAIKRHLPICAKLYHKNILKYN